MGIGDLQRPGVDYLNTSWVPADNNIEVPDAAPPTDDLMTALSEQLPSGITVVVNSSVGSSVNAGQTQ